MCAHCQNNEVASGRRKYCAICGLQASLIWKRQHRQAWREAGERYWRDNWKHVSSTDRRAYFRAYMRVYRLRQREATKSSLNAPIEGRC